MKILITGADGMLGSHIVREVLRRGMEVRAFLQPGRETGTLDPLDIEKVSGDILDEGQVRRALEGCDGLINIAASTQIWPSRSPLIWKVNFEAVRNMAEAVLELGIPSFIQIGTANSFQPGPKEAPGTEEGPYTDHIYSLDYQDSKHAAQEFLLKMHRDRGLGVKIINPSFMFGAFDSKPGAGEMVLSVYSGKTPGYTSGGKSYVPAKDVAVAAVNALDLGRFGECYIASGLNLNYKEAFDLIADTVGVKAPAIRIPNLLVDCIGLAGSIAGRLFGIRPKISYPMARLSHADCYYSNRKAVKDLGMPTSDLREAVRECFDWLKEHGYVREK